MSEQTVDVARLADELAVQRLLASYCHRCDDAEFDALVDLFAPDGVFAMGDVSARGRTELLAFFHERQGPPERRGRHLTLNTVVDVAGDRASAVSDFVFLRRVDGAVVPAIVGRYHDDLVRLDGSWRFAHREARPMGGPP
jgi:hypothetical protein